MDDRIKAKIRRSLAEVNDPAGDLLLGHRAFLNTEARIHDINVVKGWFEDERTFGDSMALLHSEVSEALEAFRKWGLNDVTLTGGKPEGIGSEFADVFIRLMDACYRYDIDLWFEVQRKIEFNATRPHRHGGKAL